MFDGAMGACGSPAEPLIYINGEFVPASVAKISVFDHGLLYGDGIFEGIRAYDGIVFQLREHIDRLYRSARCLRLDIGMDKDRMVDLVLDVLRRNRLTNAYIRLVVTRGAGALGPDPSTCPRPTVIVIAQEIPPVHGEAAADSGIRAVVVPTRRDAVDATSHEIKSLNYLNSVMAKMEAKIAGADEAILLDNRGFVCESPISNVFLVINDRLATPSVAAGILHGITRARIIELATSLRLPVEERDITPYELVNADEVFLTGTHAEIVPVISINGIAIGSGRIGKWTQVMIREFRRITRSEQYGVRVFKRTNMESVGRD